MKKLLILVAVCWVAHSNAQTTTQKSFDSFKEKFIDAYWKQNTAGAISMGYGKYYEHLQIPDAAYFASTVSFSKQWLSSLHTIELKNLSQDDKISYNIIENQLKKAIWEVEVFKIHHWDASRYNIGGSAFNIISQTDLSLDERLKMLSRRLQYAGKYYAAALSTLSQPTKEHIELAIKQNEGSLSIFGNSLTDSINVSHLTTTDKNALQQHIGLTVGAINNYIAALKKILAQRSYSFRSFRIGEKLFNEKFQYDMVTDYTAKEIYRKAIAAKRTYHKEMYGIANKLWIKYCDGMLKPSDSLLLIKTVIDKISLSHVPVAEIFNTINKQLSDLKQFIIKKELFDFDTSAPVIVRLMPAFARGVAMASANFPLPYQKKSIAYYNVADLSAMPAEKAESQLRENNDYILQILTIHEAMPGHCMQGVYNSKKSSDIVKAVFRNGAMSEGWAVYCERMMLENGWGNDAPEMWLMFYKWSLRECCNVIIDYDIHCLNHSKMDVINLLKNEAFQEEAQLEEKYHRATVSQVQLCSYFTGATEILALRAAYQKKMGSKYTLKGFHERFLGYGTAPVKFIRRAMLEK
ncbi:MAG: DUF885 domain-containing protein [Ferruginibacter sp.]